MKYKEYLNKIQEIQILLLDFLDDDEESEAKYQDLINALNLQGVQEKCEELKLFLRLLANISNYHHRNFCFRNKIERILHFLKEKIMQSFSENDIFDIFKLDKLTILYLLKEQIIKMNQHIFKEIVGSKFNFLEFFQPEVKLYIEETNENKQLQGLSNKVKEVIMNPLPNNFEENRNRGENESYICQLIREDNVVEFISYVNKTNFPLNSTIKPSIYETHTFLLESRKSETLIEYSAFFGAIQIFQYLKMNNVKLKHNIWIYVIHSRKADLIHLLEENQIDPDDKSYFLCLEESIKCHHNEIANYIRDNLLTNKNKYKHNGSIFYLSKNYALASFTVENIKREKKRKEKDAALHLFYLKNEASYGFHYYNFEFIPSDNNKIDFSEIYELGLDKLININYILFYACQYDYLTIVKLLMQTRTIDLSEKIIYHATF